MCTSNNLVANLIYSTSRRLRLFEVSSNKESRTPKFLILETLSEGEKGHRM